MASIIFQIEDELHSESVGDFDSLEEAVKELKKISVIPWNEAPNKAPCISWKTCGRHYEILEFDTSTKPWTLKKRLDALEINAKGINWKTTL